MRLIVFMLAALASGQAGAQSVHRCTDANGQPVFQQAPCPAGTGRPVVIQAPNVVDGSPAGDAMLRAQAQRRAALSEAIASGQVIDGMTDSELRQALGTPTVVNRDVVKGQERQQYVYRYPNGDSRYVYTTGGRVYATQERPAERQKPTRPCHSEREVANVRTSAASITITRDERKRLLDQVKAMEECRQ